MRRTVPTGESGQAKCGHLDVEVVQERHAWSWDGDGLTSDERALWRSRRALAELVGVLVQDDAFMERVEAVRAARDRTARAWRLSRQYGIGDLRKLIAALMTRASETADRDAGAVAMCNLGTTAVTSHYERRTRTTRRSTYLIGEAFLAPVRRGCVLLAAKGSGRRALTASEEREVRRLVAIVLTAVRSEALVQPETAT